MQGIAFDTNLLIAGVDEAGRGPLAGPVIAAAVVLNPEKQIFGLNDSKLLTEKQREDLFSEIREKALCWTFGRSSVLEIDQINILQASLLAMQRAVHYLKVKPNCVLVDGNKVPKLVYPSKAVIKGDQLVACISAASIVAKVIRDRFMRVLDKKYPLYGFAQHKGYGTKSHKKALAQHGPCKIHRKTFAPVAQWTREELDE